MKNKKALLILLCLHIARIIPLKSNRQGRNDLKSNIKDEPHPFLLTSIVYVTLYIGSAMPIVLELINHRQGRNDLKGSIKDGRDIKAKSNRGYFKRKNIYTTSQKLEQKGKKKNFPLYIYSTSTP